MKNKTTRLKAELQTLFTLSSVRGCHFFDADNTSHIPQRRFQLFAARDLQI
jgi:hypothetical protein